MALTRRQRKALLFGTLALVIAVNAGLYLYDAGAHLPKIIILGLGGFGTGAAFRALIGDWRDRRST